MKQFKLLIILTGTLYTASAQNAIDSVQRLQEVVVRSYFSEQPVFNSPASISIVESSTLSLQPASLVTAVNTASGVRMEERSPGSYRLSIRGSLLRSPFGIRNVKIYIDEFPLTDAGGNTYLNLLDAGSINRMEILKGPDASIFGANSGGVIRINPFVKNTDSISVSANIHTGSYGLFHENITAEKQWKKYRLQLGQAWQRSDGYRENSAFDRKYLQTSQQWDYSGSAQLRGLLLYSDLNYRTPGGLTEQQVQQNPRSARPSAGNTPGALEQKAGIENKTLFGGLVNETRLSKKIRHVVSVYGTLTDFKNPFITNYEVRDEKNAGIRTYFDVRGSRQGFNWEWQLGMEGARFTSEIANYNNKGGQKGNIQSSDKLKSDQSFFFTHFSADIERWFLEAAASLNSFGYRYENLSGGELSGRKKFRKQLMPRIAASYRLNDHLSWRVSAGRGYSPPTIAEVRASDNTINTDLQAETGWNIETGLRLRSRNNRFYADAVVFNYRLQDAIVRRLNENDTEYFVNAGGTKQPGFELETMYWLLPPSSGRRIVKGIQLRNSYTYSRFTFSDYRDAAADYSGNRLTGVPEHVSVSRVTVQLPASVYFSALHNFTSNIPLNDAGTAHAPSYNLVQLKAGWQYSGRTMWGFSIGADNLLNERYSLGNDLNAFGGRFFNPSPERNFYFSLSAVW